MRGEALPCLIAVDCCCCYSYSNLAEEGSEWVKLFLLTELASDGPVWIFRLLVGSCSYHITLLFSRIFTITLLGWYSIYLLLYRILPFDIHNFIFYTHFFFSLKEFYLINNSVRSLMGNLKNSTGSILRGLCVTVIMTNLKVFSI